MSSKLPHKENKKIIIYRKGKVFSKHSNQYIGRLNRAGDPVVDIKTATGMNTVYVKHLVAEYFIPNPEGLPEVINKNWNREDCRASNLRWTDRSGSFAHAKAKPKSKKVGNRTKRSDDKRLDKAIEIKNAKRSLPESSYTFIEDQNHPEAIF